MKKNKYCDYQKYHNESIVKKKSKSSNPTTLKTYACLLFVNNFMPIFAKGLAKILVGALKLVIWISLLRVAKKLLDQDLEKIWGILSSLLYNNKMQCEVNNAYILKNIHCLEYIIKSD